MADPENLSGYEDAKQFYCRIVVDQLVVDYDQYAASIGALSLHQLALSDCHRHYTERWQRVFHEYAPWAWNLPDGGQLRG